MTRDLPLLQLFLSTGITPRYLEETSSLTTVSRPTKSTQNFSPQDQVKPEIWEAHILHFCSICSSSSTSSASSSSTSHISLVTHNWIIPERTTIILISSECALSGLCAFVICFSYKSHTPKRASRGPKLLTAIFT